MSTNNLKSNIIRFKRKFHTNQLIRGSLISVLLFGAIYLIFSLLENHFWFGQSVRLGLFCVLTCLLLYFLIFKIIIPILRIIQINKGLSDEQAAKLIGQYFPEIQDKLLNLIQLSESSTIKSSLAIAAVEQKQNDLKLFDFKEAIDFKINKKYLLYVAGLICITLLVSFISPGIFSASSARIVQFNKSFERPAPFSFQVLSSHLAFKGDSYQLELALVGQSVPDEVFLLDKSQRFRLSQSKDGNYVFSYPSMTKDKSLRFSAAGYKSNTFSIKVISRPELRDLTLELDYPAYTGLTDETRTNSGSMVVPEGTNVTWSILSEEAAEVIFIADEDSSQMAFQKDQFVYQQSIRNSMQYEIALVNEYSRNKSKIVYDVSVIKDEPPILYTKYLPDTISYQSVLFTGSIEDDYGFSSLSLFYKRNAEDDYHRISIPFEKSQINQQYYLQWDLDSMHLSSEDYLEAYVQVTDNDRVNGFKSRSSQKFFLRMPSDEEIESIISEKSKESENQLDNAESKAKEINDRLKDIEDRLRNKRELDWRDKKLLEDLIKDKEKLSKEIEELAEKHQQLLDSQKEFGKQNEKLQKKASQLQELIEQVLDEETKKLYDELQKLLKENNGTDEVLEELSKIRQNEHNMEKELDRALELFKRLQLETGLDEAAKKLEELAEEQDQLADKTRAEALLEEERPQTESAQSEESEGNQQAEKTDTEQAQEDINEAFEEIQEQMDSLQQLNQELKSPEPMEDFDEQQQEIQEKLDEIPQDLQNQQQQKAGQKMKNAGQKMKNMASSMQQMQMGMEMTMMQENLDHLRNILDNLIKLSFAQESIIEEIKGVQQIDPRFIELSQEQLQLISNAKVIEDSLLSLASRVAQISNFVTREVGEINSQLERSMQELRDRNKGKAASHQQFAMTSMNNLALLLDDVLQQMQMAMAEAMGKPKKGQGQKQSLPNMSQMQQQLSQQIQQLKNSGKSGRQLSEELAKLAAKQAELRQQMEAMKQQLAGQKPGEEGTEDGAEGGTGDAGDKLGEAIQKMEENEVDLVNKQLTQELINRQQDIITRMLEAEESLREQKESPEREGETASPQQRQLPPALEDYLKAKKEEIELLKTIPLDLNPFYKKEVNDYFRRISGENQ